MSVDMLSAVFGIEDTKLNGAKRLVLLALADRADAEGYSYPSRADIARRCGIARVGTVTTTLAWLEEHGFITRDVNGWKGRDGSVPVGARPNVYRVLTPYTRNGEAPRETYTPPIRETYTPPIRETYRRTVSRTVNEPSDAQQSMFQADQPASKKRNGAKKKPAKKILDHSYRPFFEQWWEQYPRKINKAKAMVAFQDAMKAGTTNAELTTALRHYNESIAQWEAKHGEKLKWIVYPQRFISERFLDFIDGPNPDAWNAPEKPTANDEYDPEWEILGVRS